MSEGDIVDYPPGSFDGDDEVYEEDSDFETLNIPSYALNEESKHHSRLNEDGLIPFTGIHRPAQPYASDDRLGFIPGVAVSVEITNVEVHDHHVLNPYLYSITVKHGDYEWTVKRRYKNFRALHESLMLFRAKLHLPVPTRKHKLQRKTMRQRKESLPRFPRRPEIMVSEENMPERKKNLQTYLQRILRFPPLRNHHETLTFLEVSHLSFINGLGYKNKEGMIKKRSGGRTFSSRFCRCCAKCVSNMTAHYNTRWLVLKDTFLAYVNPHRGTVSDVLLMDQLFKIECGFMNTGVHHGLKLTTLNRELMLKGWTHRNAYDWKDAIENVTETVAKDFTTPNRHKSYAPFRPKGHAQWFIDGASYMSSVADAMESAKEEIFITDWWLSPEIYMKRPVTEGEKWRLDKILERKAAQGVKIFIMLFKEVELALGINSYYTKQALLKLHEKNIKVLRHPDGLLLWSHHEKMVVIDQRIAYLGGIDLCYGRYDTVEHRLTDLGSVMTSIDLNDAQIRTPLPPEKDDDGLVAGKFPMPVPLSTDQYRSSHSWPETEHEKHKMALVPHSWDMAIKGATEKAQQGPQTAAPGDLKVPDGVDAGCRKPRLSAISERSLTNEHEGQVKDEPGDSVVTNGAVPSPSEPIQNHSDSYQSQDASSPNMQSSQNLQTVVEHSEIHDHLQNTDITSDNVFRNCDNSAENVKKNRENVGVIVHRNDDRPSSKTENAGRLDKLQRQVSELSDDQQIHPLADLNLKKTSGGQCNYGVDVSPSDENRTLDTEINVEIVDLKKTGKLSISPPHVKAGASNNNMGEGTAGSSQEGEVKAVGPKARMSSKWQKVKAVTMMTSLKPATPADIIESSPSQPAEVAGRVPRKKRSSMQKLVRQARVKDQLETSGAVNDTQEGASKTSPAPTRNKFAQKTQLLMDIKDRFRKRQSKSVDVTDDKDFDYSFYRQLDRMDGPDLVLEEMGLVGSTKIWIGKDYVNFITKDFRDLDQPFSDFIDRSTTPRMPWHDIGAVVYGKAARDVARHFIQRWNFSKIAKRKANDLYPLLLPKCYTKVSVPRSVLASSIPCKVQVLRSADKWSVGISETEDSIHNAYLHSIENAQHFIYIENQFFITIMDHHSVTNGISVALFNRILKAHREGAVFRVIVVMPLLPAFEGEIGTPTGGAIQAVQFWNYASICRGGKSLLERLQEHIPDPMEYISFYGLRTHDVLSGNLVSELVYVHSKMMIVDDRTVIIGSANINDRSMLGSRDSEMALITEDVNMRQSRMNGEAYEAGWFASGLRRALFREHLGVSRVNPEVDVIDPTVASFYKGHWVKQASINTKIYDEVFRCIPTDNVTAFNQTKLYTAQGGLAKTDPAAAREKLKSIRGHLVFLPLRFLINDNLQPSVMTKEGMAPEATWT